MIFIGKGDLHSFFPRNHTKKATYIRGPLHQTKECIMHSRWGGCRGGKSVFWSKMPPPPFWALALAFVVQVSTSLSTPLEGARAHGRRAVGKGGGRLPFNAFLALTKWPFSTKMTLSKRSKIHDINN